MNIINLGIENSILNEYIYELRNKDIQKDSMRFRKNLERIGEIFGYEISKLLRYKTSEVTTPLGIAKVNILIKQPVLATILRAGLPLHQGLLNVFDKADNSFISAYRKYDKDGKFEIAIEYLSCPNLNDRVLILSDPMLATGSSMFLAYTNLLNNGKPEHTHLVTVIASKYGISHLKKNIPEKNVTLWVAAIDEELTAKAYIVPGLGDAGDLAYGSKNHD
ncbi:MAG: uracil phosphoribosyltransferase [Bacteroidales bacterium]|nr:uracil phosphoribosyltransferase [Bacteroidales bacterium]